MPPRALMEPEMAMAVLFEQQPAGEFDAAPIEGPLQGRDGGDPRTDDAVAGTGFWEGLAQVGGEAGEPGGGGGHIVPVSSTWGNLREGGSPRLNQVTGVRAISGSSRESGR